MLAFQSVAASTQPQPQRPQTQRLRFHLLRVTMRAAGRCRDATAAAQMAGRRLSPALAGTGNLSAMAVMMQQIMTIMWRTAWNRAESLLACQSAAGQASEPPHPCKDLHLQGASIHILLYKVEARGRVVRLGVLIVPNANVLHNIPAPHNTAAELEGCIAPAC